MPEQPKRRGRPPGSPNKPKTYSPPITTSSVDTSRLKIISFGDPVSMDQAGYVGEWTLMGPDPIKVVLVMGGRAFADPASEREVEWPANWRLPQAGEAIHLSKTFGGFVQFVDWIVDERVVRIKLV